MLRIGHPEEDSRFRFTLRTLMVFVALVAVALSWFPWKRREILERKAEIAAVSRKMEAQIFYQYEMDGIDHLEKVDDGTPPGPAWLRRLLGDEAFAEPEIRCYRTKGHLAHLKRYPRLQKLILMPGAIRDSPRSMRLLLDSGT